MIVLHWQIAARLLVGGAGTFRKVVRLRLRRQSRRRRAEGASSRGRRHRGGWGLEESVHLPSKSGLWGGAVLPLQTIFFSFSRGNNAFWLTFTNAHVYTLTGYKRVIKPRSRQRERLSASMLSICSSVCLYVCRQNANNAIFSKTAIYSYVLYWRPIGSRTWAFQRTHYGTPKIQDGGDPQS